MFYLKYLCGMFLAFSGGVIIAGGVYAFIAVIGVIPRLAQKTKTEQYARLYEEAVMLGGISGAAIDALHFKTQINIFVGSLLSFCGGVFLGVLAMSLAEVLNVIPIFTRRARIQQGIFYFILCIAIGKFVGSILYFTVPGFYKPQ